MRLASSPSPPPPKSHTWPGRPSRRLLYDPGNASGKALDAHSPLMQRVLMLLRCPYPLEQKPPRWWTLTAPLLVVGLSLLSAWLSLALLSSPTLSAESSTVAHLPTQFRVNHFVASPLISNARDRSPFYTLPLLLPAEFDLTVEIHASATALCRIRLLGLTLATPPPASRGAAASPEAISKIQAWHQVHVHRQAAHLLMTVDGQTRTFDQDLDSLSDWLTLEPDPDETAILRNLVVTW